MKSRICLILCAVLLLGILTGCTAGERDREILETASSMQVRTPNAVSVIPADFEEKTRAQSFAIAMACWYNGFDETDTAWPFFAWEATGWYAAWLYRVQEADLLPAEQASDFQRSLGMLEELSGPENWLGEHTPAALRSTDGSVSYDFREYKLRLNELLGTEIELSFFQEADLSETVGVIRHFGYQEQAERKFRITYTQNPDPLSRFAYRLEQVEMPAAEPQIDPTLTFTWEELIRANTLSNVLSQYPSVRIYDRDYSYGNSTWLFLHQGEPVMLTGGNGLYSGKIHGCSFDYGETEDGMARARISSIESGEGRTDVPETAILDYFDGFSVLRLDRNEDDLIWADAVYASGYRQKLAIDYGTLVMREVISISEEGTVLGSTVFEYTNPVPQLEFLKSWDQPLRKIQVIWESYPDGKRELHQETVKVPIDWEYLPYQAFWGDYTAYTNDQYLGDYVYPGDGVEYMLFLTTVKG